jgi:hypothetical protein
MNDQVATLRVPRRELFSRAAFHDVRPLRLKRLYKAIGCAVSAETRAGSGIVAVPSR